MKKYMYTLLAVFTVGFCQAQLASITQAEYFWDADPGEGSGTAILAGDGGFGSAFEQFAAAGLAMPGVGKHRFSVRVKDNQGAWGPAFTNIINVEASPVPTPLSLTQAEYFWDTDPGEGSGTPFAAADGSFNSAFEKLSQSAVPIVNPVGLHVFNVRVKDNAGTWGPVFKNAVYIESVLSVDAFAAGDNYYFIPNPASSVIRFNKDVAHVIVADLNGRQVAASVSNNQLNIENLTAGTYILKITTPEGLTFNKKMIKR